jgi:hypothetical protein
MAIKFGPNEVFTTVGEEDLGNSNHLDPTMQTDNSEDEAKAPTKLLNITRTFQGIAIVTPTRVECPFSPTPHYYVEMPCNLTTLASNLELIVYLKDSHLELDDLNVSYQTQQILALTYYQQGGLLGRNL